MIPSTAEAWNLVTEFVQSPTLRRHLVAVEIAMRAYADRFNEDPELWGVVGLLHDFDYDKYPEVSAGGHPLAGNAILEQRGIDAIIRDAILAHAPEVTGRRPSTLLEKTLVAVDELTGFIIAVTLVRPDRKISSVELKSIKKKWKERAFAAPVDREYIAKAALELGVPLDEHIEFVLRALQSDAERLGLA